MKILFGLFLIAHALIHLSFISPKPPQQPGAPEWPFDITKSWLMPSADINFLKTVGIVLTLVATLGFVASGLAWFGFPVFKDYWSVLIAVSSISSLVLIVLFWKNWFVMGPIIDLALLYLVYFKNIKP